MTSTEPTWMVTLRWIDADNATTLGYDADEYAAGRWVTERDGQWIADLGGDEISLAQARAAAADMFGVPDAASAWAAGPANYGTVYTAWVAR